MISRQIVGTVILAGMFWATVADRAAGQKDKSSTWGVPVVMEEATVRGKVVILEDRQQDRRVVEGLRIQLWQEQDDDSENAEPEAKVRRLLNETTTDKLGMFDLPQLAVGDYELNRTDR